MGQRCWGQNVFLPPFSRNGRRVKESSAVGEGWVLASSARMTARGEEAEQTKPDQGCSEYFSGAWGPYEEGSCSCWMRATAYLLPQGEKGGGEFGGWGGAGANETAVAARHHVVRSTSWFDTLTMRSLLERSPQSSPRGSGSRGQMGRGRRENFRSSQVGGQAPGVATKSWSRTSGAKMSRCL